MTSHTPERLHALDAVRGFALICGVVLHAAMSYLPGFQMWPLADRSPSEVLGVTFYVIHMFRMTTFFVIAGFFARMTLERQGTRAFVRNRSIRILLPLVVGWIVLFPLIVAAMAWGAGGTTALRPPAGAPSVGGALSFPLTHLWFLYVLILLYGAALIARWLVQKWADPTGRRRARLDTVVRLVVSGPWAPFLLGAPLVLALSVSPWLLWFGIPTPDQSLVPNLPAAVAFCVAFAFGWLVQRQIGLLKTIERQWPMHLASAAVLTGASLAIVGPAPVFTLATQSWTTTVYAVLYAAGGWSWALALLGAALRFFAGPSAFRRYVSDASYWIYLAHLPLVFGLQAAMKDLPWHWSVKFPLLLSAALALLFGSYHTLVRFTFVGEVLNGRRYRRGQLELTATADAADAAADAAGAERQVERPLARLTAATKRFGKTLALDGLDLDVRRGEVLALLGPNGAGKSTAISLLLGLLEPDTGTARLFGQPPGNVEARYQVGVMMQEVGLAPEMRVRELLDLTTRYYPAPMSVDEALALTQTTGLANLPYGKLSAGQKRQAQFALAVCGRPALLFLDEPTVGLDVQARETLWAAIRLLLAQGVSMVLTTHYLEEAEALATRVAVLSKGRLIAMGTVDDMRALVARKRVSCISTLPAEDVGAWTGVSAARRDGDRLHIVASEADQVVRRLLAADTSLRDLEVQKAGLAEAFAEITQEAA